MAGGAYNGRLRFWGYFWGLFVLLPFIVSPALAQKPDTLITKAVSIAKFQEARALATDGHGLLYVIDGGKSVLYKLNGDGKLLQQVGGRGSGKYQFDEPMDVEATNGLEIWVADKENHRLQRFSGEFRYLESVPLLFETHTPRQVAGFFSTNADYDNKQIWMEGTPIMVTTNTAKEVLAFDELHSFLVIWGADRSIRGYVGRYDAGDAALLDPVAIVTAPNGTIFVADRGRGTVMEYDAYGSFLRSMGNGQLKDLRGLSLFGDRLLVTGKHHVWVYEADGKQLFNYAFQLGEPLVEAVFANRFLYLLTSTKLYKFKP